MVMGFERGSETQTPHLQAYLEFVRSYRYNVVRTLLAAGYWRPARGSAKANFAYCTKSDNYIIIGNFDREAKNAKVSERSIISALLDPKCSLQVQTSAEYAKNSVYFDKITKTIACAREKEQAFLAWKEKDLFIWQDKVLRRLFTQNERTVLWIWDKVGNAGKTFLVHYLSTVYEYLLLDGNITASDLAYFFSSTTKGVCFDVARSSRNNLDYSALEGLKNGYLVTGKYEGRTLRFRSAKVIVFANFKPDRSQLSDDRWDIHKIGA